MQNPLTLNLTTDQVYRLRSALQMEEQRWTKYALEAKLGKRPQGSAEGAMVLATETREIRDQLSAWAQAQHELVGW